MKIKKRLVRIVFPLSLLGMGLLFFPNYLIEKNAVHKTYSDSNTIEKNKVGLVLGTSKRLRDGRANLYFEYRIDAVVELYQNGKIDFVLVSGDNGTKYYNEPSDFKKALVKKGVPEKKIFLDYAGFRTLDSVVRAKEVFGQEKVTIISQKFHNERAIYLAEKNGLQAIGYNAKDISGRYGLKVKLREYFARTKAFLDILFGVGPKFLGEEIMIQ